LQATGLDGTELALELDLRHLEGAELGDQTIPGPLDRTSHSAGIEEVVAFAEGTQFVLQPFDPAKQFRGLLVEESDTRVDCRLALDK
jgi:hypothetical protein